MESYGSWPGSHMQYTAITPVQGRETARGRKGVHMAISRELLEILACPKCKGDIRLNEARDGLICDSCKLLYHIKDDIPVMLIDEAEKIGE